MMTVKASLLEAPWETLFRIKRMGNKAEAGCLHLLVLRATSSNGNAQPYKALLYRR